MSFVSVPSSIDQMDLETFAREFLTPEKYGAVIMPTILDSVETATTPISAGGATSAKLSLSSVLDVMKAVIGNGAFERAIHEVTKEMEIKSNFRKHEPVIDPGAGFGDW